jgi:heme/copper-type cytochrome/quinol oxidase subunit 2
LVTSFGFLIVPLLFVAICLFFIKDSQEDKGGTSEINFEQFKGYLVTGGAILITLLAVVYSTKAYISLIKIINNKEYTEVEGYVENFVQITKIRHPVDSFTVNKIRFSSENGFDKTKAQGSPIYAGQYVKIHYFKGSILKLWVKEREYSRWYK